MSFIVSPTLRIPHRKPKFSLKHWCKKQKHYSDFKCPTIFQNHPILSWGFGKSKMKTLHIPHRNHFLFFGSTISIWPKKDNYAERVTQKYVYTKRSNRGRTHMIINPYLDFFFYLPLGTKYSKFKNTKPCKQHAHYHYIRCFLQDKVSGATSLEKAASTSFLKHGLIRNDRMAASLTPLTSADLYKCHFDCWWLRDCS